MLWQVNSNFQITLPIEFRKRFNIHEGDLLEVVENEDGVIVRPADPVEIEFRKKQVIKNLHEIYEKLADNPYANLPEEEVMEIVNEKIREVREEKRKEREAQAQVQSIS
ncbi:MAG: AbrB/MazE/SpoVT family DNA-binding domain-containing protein [Nitrospirae bacterium YQR-1]